LRNLGVTQRVEFIESYNERRDCLDQNWSKLAFELGFNPIPLANIKPRNVAQYLKDLHLDAIILSGGNSLTCIDANAKDAAVERDNFEIELIKQAIKLNIPLLGVCRGLQIINHYFGGNLSPIEGHVAVKHELVQCTNAFVFSNRVNSYHNWSIAKGDLANDLKVLAADEEGHCEALHHQKYKIMAIMWHPERESPFLSKDIQFMKEFLK